MGLFRRNEGSKRDEGGEIARGEKERERSGKEEESEWKEIERRGQRELGGEKVWKRVSERCFY